MTGLRDRRGAGRPHSRACTRRSVTRWSPRASANRSTSCRRWWATTRATRCSPSTACPRRCCSRASRSWRGEWPCLLVAEGLGQDGRRVLPAGTREEDVEIVVIVDPIDGTRGLMVQKRPAWVLTGVAPYRGGRETLADIALAVQTEIPLVKQHLCDTMWAIAGGGAHGERFDRATGARRPLALRPSRADHHRPGLRRRDALLPGRARRAGRHRRRGGRGGAGPDGQGTRARVRGPVHLERAASSTSWSMGHDRWVADLRPLIEPLLAKRGRALGICSHPYDLCTELIAREAGVHRHRPVGRAAVRAARRVHRRRVRGLRQRGHPLAGRSRVARGAARARSSPRS